MLLPLALFVAGFSLCFSFKCLFRIRDSVSFLFCLFCCASFRFVLFVLFPLLFCLFCYAPFRFVLFVHFVSLSIFPILSSLSFRLRFLFCFVCFALRRSFASSSSRFISSEPVVHSAILLLLNYSPSSAPHDTRTSCWTPLRSRALISSTSWFSE